MNKSLDSLPLDWASLWLRPRFLSAAQTQGHQPWDKGSFITEAQGLYFAQEARTGLRICCVLTGKTHYIGQPAVTGGALLFSWGRGAYGPLLLTTHSSIQHLLLQDTEPKSVSISPVNTVSVYMCVCERECEYMCVCGVWVGEGRGESIY
jgi:hypothetical protein